MRKLFDAFFTTKKGKLGTGLGTSIIKSIIEAHGGHISAYSKNLTQSASHGLVFNITFPVFEREQQSATHSPPIVVLKEGLVGAELEHVLKVFTNVSLAPRILHAVSDLKPREFDPETFSIIGVPRAIATVREKQPTYSRLLVLSTHQGTLQVQNPLKRSHPTPFSEQFVISRLTGSA
jgi:hypothetical protein